MVFLLSVYKGMMLFYHGIHEKTRTIALAVVLGLITYYAHGVLNSYIDYDKIAVPLWGFCAILVALEVIDKKPVAETISAISGMRLAVAVWCLLWFSYENQRNS